jgi:hypothetical protein
VTDYRDPSPRWNPPTPSGWRWKPVDLVVLALAFAVYWPLGLIVLAWKLWNDRQPVPQDLGDLLQGAANKLQQGFDGVMGGFSSGSAAPGAPTLTGNAAFDAHIREEWARIEADQRRLTEEIEAFRTFMASERSGDRDLYERFRRTKRM